MKRWLAMGGVVAALGLSGGRGQAQQLLMVQGEEFRDTSTARLPGCPPPGRTRYYQVAGKYPRSSATLAAGAQQWLRQQGRAYAASGYVTFRFVVDCRGRRLPKTQVLQATPAYQPCHFEPALVEALYQYLQTLTEWPVARSASPTSYVAYLTFKLQDGNVVAVVP